MARDCYFSKVGAFASAAINLLAGGFTLGGTIYVLVTFGPQGINYRKGLIVVMFLMSLLLIHNGVLLIVGIVMVNSEYVLLYLVLNSISWFGGSGAILKEMAAGVTLGSHIGFSMLLTVVWCSLFIVYQFYKHMRKVRTNADVEKELKEISNSV